MIQSIGKEGLEAFYQVIDEFKPRMQVQRVGSSFENRPIYGIRWGSGPIKIFFWAQMHGDEPTGCKAIIDLCQILEGMQDYQQVSTGKRIRWRSAFSLYFIPLLNPDGAYYNYRFNAMGIDLNRDARTLIAPESQLLDQIVCEYRPELTINLHDSSRSYAVGETSNPATISFSAPAVTKNTSKVPANRLKAMQLIYSSYCWLEEYLPGHTARYFDIFEDRAFGETIQQKGIPQILIESGGYPNDPQRKKATDLVLQSIFHIFQQLEKNAHLVHTAGDYLQIPTLSESMFDLLYPSAKISVDGRTSFTADVGIRKQGDTLLLEQIGDLKDYHAYERIENANFRLNDLLKLRPKHLNQDMLAMTGKSQSI